MSGYNQLKTRTHNNNKTQQRGYALSTISFATTYLRYSIYFLDSIVTPFVLPSIPTECSIWDFRWGRTRNVVAACT